MRSWKAWKRLRRFDGKSLMAYSRIRIEDAGRHTGEPVEIAGWLYNLRKSGKIVFPLLRDGTGTHAGRGREGQPG